MGRFLDKRSRLISEGSDDKKRYGIFVGIINGKHLLIKLKKTIDLKRFEFDDRYRPLTIFGLFMSDDPKFVSAKQFVMKHNLSIDI